MFNCGRKSLVSTFLNVFINNKCYNWTDDNNSYYHSYNNKDLNIIFIARLLHWLARYYIGVIQYNSLSTIRATVVTIISVIIVSTAIIINVIRIQWRVIWNNHNSSKCRTKNWGTKIYWWCLNEFCQFLKSGINSLCQWIVQIIRKCEIYNNGTLINWNYFHIRCMNTEDWCESINKSRSTSRCKEFF